MEVTGSGRISVYCKLREDGSGDSKSLEQSDYDNMMKFIKTSFPSSLRVKRELDDTMKRTFVLGRKANKERSKKKKPKSNPQGITGKRKRRFRITKIIPRHLPYSDFVQLHSLWKEYIIDILKGETKIANVQQKLNRADLHGAKIKVVQAKCESNVNIEGIVIAETKNTFVIVTESNETKTLPKADSVFEVLIPKPEGIMQICGNAFISRPAERSSKKIKSFIDLIGPKAHRKALLQQKVQPVDQ